MTHYGFAFTQPTSEHYGQMRVDQTISSSDTFFTRYTIDQAARHRCTTLPSFTVRTREPEPIFDSVGESYFLDILAEHGPVLLQPNHHIVATLGSSRERSAVLDSYAGQPMGQFNVNGLTINGTNTTGPSSTCRTSLPGATTSTTREAVTR